MCGTFRGRIITQFESHNTDTPECVSECWGKYCAASVIEVK